MKPEYIPLLVCPHTKRPLEVRDAVVEHDRIKAAILVEPCSGHAYPIVDFIPRFVPQHNYADNFAVEWALHNRTQYDDYSGFALSRQRFEQTTQWEKDLVGEIILEAGSGAGRFTNIALDTGALLVSFDYSRAVEANYRSNGSHERLLLVQADMYALPFRAHFFDRAFCFGVLQHTPDPKKSFFSLVQSVKPGGKIAADIYKKTLARWLLHTKYWVRPFTRHCAPEHLYRAVKSYIDWMWPCAKLIRQLPGGYLLNWRLLIADHSPIMPNGDEALLKEWAYLDTFDMLSPRYDKPQTLKEFKRWYHEAGLVDIDVHYGFNGIEGRGTRPQ